MNNRSQKKRAASGSRRFWIGDFHPKTAIGIRLVLLVYVNPLPLSVWIVRRGKAEKVHPELFKPSRKKAAK
ncbi:MAG: hypothetical protein LUH48_05415 [Clostridiales bacterium]|nr:hypothetical protein [Clostridiales bacterium]